MPHSPKVLEQFEIWGITPPTSDPHGTSEDIEKNMDRLLPNSWHLKGNVLTGKTKLGPLVQTIPTNYILEGADEQGLPKFRKIA